MATTPKMDLKVNVPGVTTGPEWAEDAEDNKELLDDHDHSDGKGARIPANALNINGEVDFQGNGVLSARVLSVVANGRLASDAGCLYMDSSGDLHWVDDVGADVQITSGSSLFVSTLDSNLYSTETKSADFALSGTNKTLIRVDTTAADRIVTLPAANTMTAGRHFRIWDAGNGAHKIYVQAQLADFINGIAGGPGGAHSFKCASGWAELVNTDGVHNWSLTMPLNGTIDNGLPGAGENTGHFLCRSGASPRVYTFTKVDLADTTNMVTGILPGANVQAATDSNRGVVKLSGDVATYATADDLRICQASDDGGGVFVFRPEVTDVSFGSVVGVNIYTGGGAPLNISGGAGVGTDGGELRLAGGTATTGNRDGGDVHILGGAASGTGVYGGVSLAFNNSDANPALVAADIGSAGTHKRIVGIFGPTLFSDAGGGDQVVYLKNATTNPSPATGTDTPVGGVLVWSDSGRLAIKNSAGDTLQLKSFAGAGGFVGVSLAGTLTVRVNVGGVLVDRYIPLYS